MGGGPRSAAPARLIQSSGRRGRAGGRAAALVLVLVALFLLSAVPAAQARSYRIVGAHVEVVVEPDGNLLIREHLTFRFDGTFRGAFRDVPLHPGETITEVGVFEDGVAYRPGASTELGSAGEPGTYGVEHRGSRVRIVWHYVASDEDRVFTVAYRVQGRAIAWDDVTDLYLRVWGDEWDFRLDRLTAEVILPEGAAPGDVRVWGHPAKVPGHTGLGSDQVSPSLEAGPVPAGQWVEMRVVFPTALLDTTDGATVRPGDGLDGILRDQLEQEGREQREIERILQAQRARNVSLLSLIGFVVPIPLVITWVFRRYGSEPRVLDYDREYEQDPPSDHAPAVVGALVSQGAADEAEFTATLFDLIRRGVFVAQPVTVDRRTWGGRRREQISDLEIGLGDVDQRLTAFERNVVTVVRRVVGDGSQPLTRFRTRIRDDAAANADTYQSFRSAVRKAVSSAGLLDESGRYLGPAIVFLAVAGLGVLGWLVVGPVLDASLTLFDLDVMRVGLVVVTAVGLVLTMWLATKHVLWVRRSKDGARLDARWRAFRRYLRDFSRLEEAPPISLALWEQFLVYGIALGVAEDVLEAARLRAPEELNRTSSIYWYGNQGFGGHSSNAISGIEKALTGSFRPPPSSTGGGGGFSGGGGGGRGGGGGGAW